MKCLAQFPKTVVILMMFVGVVLDVAARPPLPHEAQDPRAQAYSDLTVLSHESGKTMVIGEGHGNSPDAARAQATIAAEDRLIGAVQQRFYDLVNSLSSLVSKDANAAEALDEVERSFRVESIPYVAENTKVFEEGGGFVCLRLMSLSDTDMDRVILAQLRGDAQGYALLRDAQPVRELEGRVDKSSRDQ